MKQHCTRAPPHLISCICIGTGMSKAHSWTSVADPSLRQERHDLEVEGVGNSSDNDNDKIGGLQTSSKFPMSSSNNSSASSFARRQRLNDRQYGSGAPNLSGGTSTSMSMSDVPLDNQVLNAYEAPTARMSNMSLGNSDVSNQVSNRISNGPLSSSNHEYELPLEGRPGGDGRVNSQSDVKSSSGSHCSSTGLNSIGSSLHNSVASMAEDCIYESPSTQIYKSIDSGGNFGPSSADSPRKVAIKILFDPDPEDDDLAALDNEYSILVSKLSHCERVRHAIKQGKQDGFQAIYLEWAEGTALSDWLSSSRTARKCSLVDKTRLAREICLALSEVHNAGVTHRLLSADNIIVDCCRVQDTSATGQQDHLHASFRSIATSDTGGSRSLKPGQRLIFSIKLIDFGYAESMEDSGGTIVVNDEAFRDDLAALGVVLGQLYGFDDEQDNAHAPSIIPRSIVRLLDNLAANSHGTIYAGSYTSAKEVIKDIDYMLDEPDTYLYDPIKDDVLSLIEGTNDDEYDRAEERSAPSVGDGVSPIHTGGKMVGSVVERFSDRANVDNEPIKLQATSCGDAASVHSDKSTCQNQKLPSEDVLVAGCNATSFGEKVGGGDMGGLVLDHAIGLIQSLQKTYAEADGSSSIGVADIQQDIVENLASGGRFNFVWLTQSDALPNSLKGLSDAIPSGGFFVAVFFGEDAEAAARPAAAPSQSPGGLFSRLRTMVGIDDGIKQDDVRVASLLDPNGMFEPNTYRSRSAGQIDVCIIQRRNLNP